MKQNVVVIKELPNGNAMVSMERSTACGGECGSCAGCSPAMKRVVFEAVNPVGAKAGDFAVVESGTGKILGIAALVYLLPLILFITLYAISPLYGAAGFAAGIAAFFPLNKVLSKKQLYTVVDLTKQGE